MSSEEEFTVFDSKLRLRASDPNQANKQKVLSEQCLEISTLDSAYNLAALKVQILCRLEQYKRAAICA